MSASPTVEVYGASTGVGQVLTASYAASAFQANQRAGSWRRMTLYITATGTAPTSFEWRLTGSDDAGTTWFSECDTRNAAGVIAHAEMVRGLLDDTGAPANGLYKVNVDLTEACLDLFRLEWKRTGGDGTTTVQINAQFFGAE